MLRPIAQGCCYQCPSPCGRPLPTHASAGDPHTLRGRLTPSPVGSVLLSPGTWAHIALFLFPPVLWRSCNPVPQAFKVRFPGDSQSLGKIPRLESLMWGLEPSQLCKDFFGIIILQFVVHLPSKIRIWFYGDCALPTISLKLLLCPWMLGIFFLVGSDVFLLRVIQQPVMILLLWQKMSTVLVLCHLEPISSTW